MGGVSETRYWVCKGERRVVQNPELAAKMLKLGITELPPELTSTIIGSYCAEHAKATQEWRRRIDLDKGYLLAPMTAVKANPNGFCQWHANPNLTLKDECDNPPANRYQLYFTSPGLIRRFVQETPPEYRVQYAKFLKLE